MLARDLTLVNPRPLINLGGLYILRENFERAIEILRAATAMTPESAEAYYNLGIALFRSRRLRAAEVPLLRAVAQRMLAAARAIRDSSPPNPE